MSIILKCIPTDKVITFNLGWDDGKTLQYKIITNENRYDVLLPKKKDKKDKTDN